MAKLRDAVFNLVHRNHAGGDREDLVGRRHEENRGRRSDLQLGGLTHVGDPIGVLTVGKALAIQTDRHRVEPVEILQRVEHWNLRVAIRAIRPEEEPQARALGNLLEHRGRGFALRSGTRLACLRVGADHLRFVEVRVVVDRELHGTTERVRLVHRQALQVHVEPHVLRRGIVQCLVAETVEPLAQPLSR